MKQSTNFGMNLPEGNNVVDIDVLNANITNSIDKGLTLDVGDSTGTGNDYVLNIGSITLSNTNKGIAFRFWADKDSTGNVTINTNYNLLKGVGKPVSNLKAGNPYTIVYDGGTNFFLGSGSSVDSDKVTATEKDVLINKTFIGTDEEIHTGSMTEHGTVTKQLNINETFTLGEGHINSLNVTQNIPLMNPNWNDIWETNQYTVGTHMYNNGLNYALLKVPNNHYINGVNWVSAYTPDLKPENIVAGKNILGVGGSAPVFSQGNFTKSTGENELKTISLGFKPKFVYIVAKNNDDNTGTAIYYSMGYQEYIPVLPKYFDQNSHTVTNDLLIQLRYKNSPSGYLTILDNGFQLKTKMPNENGNTQTIYWCALG